MWWTKAACKGMDWFIQPGRTADKKAVCARCSVAQDCLDNAFELEDFGEVRGGLTGKERRKLSPFVTTK